MTCKTVLTANSCSRVCQLVLLVTPLIVRFWDLEAKLSGQRAHVTAGITTMRPEITAYTLSLADPDTMRAKAAQHANRPLLKIKLGE